MRSVNLPIRVLPADYREVRQLRLNQRGRLFWLNILSLVPMMIGGVIVYGLLILYHAAGAPLVIHNLPDSTNQWVGLVLVLPILPLHELMHGLMITRFGHRARYGVKLLVLFATADGAYFRRNEFIQIALAPLVILSAVGLFLMLFLPAGLAQWIALAVILNAAGAIGDIWMALAALRYDSSALVQDEADSMRIFTRITVLG